MALSGAVRFEVITDIGRTTLDTRRIEPVMSFSEMTQDVRPAGRAQIDKRLEGCGKSIMAD
jgi:hypothetical protein